MAVMNNKNHQVHYTQTHKSPPVKSESWGKLKQRGVVDSSLFPEVSPMCLWPLSEGIQKGAILSNHAWNLIPQGMDLHGV